MPLCDAGRRNASYHAGVRTLVACLMFLATAAGPHAQSVKADHYLDIPGHTHTGTSGAGAFFPTRHSVSSSSHPPPSPLKVTLVSVDRTDFVYGEEFVYEVLIENISKELVTLPWSPDQGAFVQPAPRIPSGYISGSVYLLVESASGQPAVLALLDSQSLYGSDEVSRSRLALAPGRTALLRVPAQWSATMDEGRTRILQQPDGAVQVRAVFSVHADRAQLTRSTNTLPMRVVARQLR